MTSVLDFINRVRTICELTEWVELPFLGTEPDHETGCVVAAALGVPVGESGNPEWAAQGLWVMRFDDLRLARRVGVVTGQAWLSESPEVRLPEVLVDLAVAQHLDAVVPDDVGFVRGWWVPTGNGDRHFHKPGDPLIPGDCGVLSKAA